MEPSKTTKSSHWSINDFYNKSWDLTWKNKKLWILGLAVSMYAGGGGGGGGNSSFDSSNLQQLQENQQQEQQLPESPYSDFEIVDDAGAQERMLDLGQEKSIKGPVGEVAESIEEKRAFEEENAEILLAATDGLGQVPVHVWVVMVLEILVFIVGVTIFGFFLVAWSHASLIKGVAEAAADKKVELLAISRHAIDRAKSVIWIMIVPGLKFVLQVFLALFVGGLAMAILVNIEARLGFLAILVGIGGVLWFSYEAIRLSVALIYALRYCVEDNLTGKEAFDQAYALAKGNLWKTLKLGLANAIVTGIIVLAVFLPVLGVGFGTVMKDVMNNSVTWMTFAPVGMTLLLTLPVMTLVQGILKVFTFSTWHYAYQVLKHQKVTT